MKQPTSDSSASISTHLHHSTCVVLSTSSTTGPLKTHHLGIKLKLSVAEQILGMIQKLRLELSWLISCGSGFWTRVRLVVFRHSGIISSHVGRYLKETVKITDSMNTDTILTSFPRRWGRNKPDSSAVHRGIRDHLGKLDSGQINSIYDLALIIIDQCSRVFFDRTKTADRQPRVMDLFASAIGDVTNKQTIAYEHFCITHNRLLRFIKQNKNL